MSSCEVFSNCLKNYDCDFCVDYSQYLPVDKKIKCQRQIKRKLEKKEQKILHKDASRRGKANRNKGMREERSLLSYLQSLDIKAERVPAGGIFKSNSKYASDLNIFVGKREYKMESKYRTSGLLPLYNKLEKSESKVLTVDGFCVILPLEKLFKSWLYDNEALPLAQATGFDDKGFKWLHKFFDQDDVPFVAMRGARREWLIAIHHRMIKKRGQINHVSICE